MAGCKLDIFAVQDALTLQILPLFIPPLTKLAYFYSNDNSFDILLKFIVFLSLLICWNFAFLDNFDGDLCPSLEARKLMK